MVGVKFERNASRAASALRIPAGRSPQSLTIRGYNIGARKGARMQSGLANPCAPPFLLRITCLAALTTLLSGWSTCNALFVFNSCPGSVPQPQITSLSPNTIPGGAESTPLIVNGSSFVPQSQIIWNGSALQTTFMDSHHLQTAITQQTFGSLGARAGATVEISVESPASAPVFGCPNGGSSATLILAIN